MAVQDVSKAINAYKGPCSAGDFLVMVAERVADRMGDNGAIREKVYGKFMGELTAHQLSTLAWIILFGVYIWILTGWVRIESSRQALLIGGIWLIMTTVFEFVFGHYIMMHPWNRLLHDYNILKGRVWSLVLIWTFVAPYAFFRLRY